MSTTTTTQTTTTLPPSGPVSAILNFYDPPSDGSKPYNYVEVPSSGPQRNFSAVAENVSLQDIRGREHEFVLDRHGFEPLMTSLRESDFSSDESIKETYYPQVEALLHSSLSGSPKRVLLFDHTIRRAMPNAHRAPVTRTHIDQTLKSAAQRVHFHMGPEAEELLKGRVRIVNVWRPLNGPVEAHPLAVADSETVSDELLVPVEHRYPDRTGETAAVKFDQNVNWWYWSGMRNEERLLLQCYDSESGSRVPHTAFEDPRSTPTSKPRESIEVRALIFG